MGNHESFIGKWSFETFALQDITSPTANNVSHITARTPQTTIKPLHEYLRYTSFTIFTRFRCASSRPRTPAIAPTSLFYHENSFNPTSHDYDQWGIDNSLPLMWQIGIKPNLTKGSLDRMYYWCSSSKGTTVTSAAASAAFSSASCSLTSGSTGDSRTSIWRSSPTPDP